MDEESRLQQVAARLPAQWRDAFVRFVETGHVDKPFLEFVESDEEAQAAVDVMFHETAAAFERLGSLLHSRKNSSLRPGDTMQDGTIFAGISPDTHRPMYTTPADAPLTMKWKDAMKYAAKLDAHGHHDWRAPTKAELNVLYENRDKGALKGTFNVTGSIPAGWYWSSTENGIYHVWGQRFSDGLQPWTHKDYDSSLRCVR